MKRIKSRQQVTEIKQDISTADVSDLHLHALLKRIRATNSPTELRRLSDQL